MRRSLFTIVLILLTIDSPSTTTTISRAHRKKERIKDREREREGKTPELSYPPLSNETLRCSPRKTKAASLLPPAFSFNYSLASYGTNSQVAPPFFASSFSSIRSLEMKKKKSELNCKFIYVHNVVAGGVMSLREHLLLLVLIKRACFLMGVFLGDAYGYGNS